MLYVIFVIGFLNKMEGSNESYALKWSDFGSDFAEGVHCLLREEAMVDVTLAVDGRFLQAHKLVLSVCSSYFKNLFKVNPCKHPIVIIKDVSYHLLSNMMDFIYKGEANIQLNELNMFMNLAENLKIKGLAEKIQRECSQVGLFTESSSQKRKRKIMQSFESDESENESRSIEKRKLKKRLNSSTKRQRKKKMKSENIALEEKVSGVDNDSDSNPLVTLVSAKHKEPRFDDSSADDNNVDENSQDFEIPPAVFTSNGLGETTEQGLQECDEFGLDIGLSKKAAVFNPIWEFFPQDVEDVFKRRCVACGTRLKYVHGNSNVSNLVRHLRRHDYTFQKYLQIREIRRKHNALTSSAQ